MFAKLFVAMFICNAVFAFQTQKTLSIKNTSHMNLFAEIKAQIAAGGPLANIEGLLDELEDQINGEQASHAAMLARNQASCAAEEEFRTGEIAEGNSALVRAVNHLAACESSLEKTLVDIENTKVDIADVEAALATAIQMREAQHAVYNQKVAEHQHAIQVLNGAFSILDDFVTEDASLIQLSKQTSKMAKAAFKIQQSHIVAPAIAFFAQMATSELDLFLDEASVERVRQLIQACVDACQDSLNEYHANEEVAQDNFDALRNHLEQSLRDLNDSLVRLTDHAEEMAQCVLEEQVLIQSSTDKVARNQKLLDLSREMCAAFEQEYEAATAGRNEELELLGVVRKMVQKRLGGLGASVVGRDDAFDNEAVATYEGDAFEHDGGNRDDALEGYGF